MDRGWLFEKGFRVRGLCNESFIVEVAGEQFAFTDVNDLMGFLIDEKDAFLNRKAPAA